MGTVGSSMYYLLVLCLLSCTCNAIPMGDAGVYSGYGYGGYGLGYAGYGYGHGLAGYGHGLAGYAPLLHGGYAGAGLLHVGKREAEEDSEPEPEPESEPEAEK